MASETPQFIARSKRAAQHGTPARGTRGRAAAQTNRVKVVGPHTPPSAADLAQDRAAARAAGATGYAVDHVLRNQEALTNSGHRLGKHKGKDK